MHIQLNAKALKSMLEFTDDKDVARTHIHGVYVEASADDIRYIATDGAKMGIYRESSNESGIIFAATIPCRIIKSMRIGHKISAVASLQLGDEPGDLHTISYNGASYSFNHERDIGQYPQYRRVIPSTVSGETAQFDTVHLSAFTSASKLLDMGIPVVAHNGQSAALVRMSIYDPATRLNIWNDRFIGVIMPMIIKNNIPLLCVEWL